MGRSTLSPKELPSGGTTGQHLVKKTDAESDTEWSTVVPDHTHSNKSILDGDTASYTTEEESKLVDIDDNANNYSHPANHPPAIITQDVNNRFVTDAEKTAWNGKEDALGFTPENVADKGQSNGYTPLDGAGKVPTIHIPTSPQNYLGTYDIITNTPTVIDGTGTNGDYYKCSTAGTRDFGSGNVTVAEGDSLIYNGTIWEDIPSSDLVQSVAGKVGVVTLNTDDVSEAANKYYTESRVNANTNVAANTAHRSSDGKNHSDVVSNNSHRSGSGSDHSDVASNTTHRGSDGKNHSDVVLNNTHRSVVTGNPHVVTKTEIGLSNVDNLQQVPLSQKGSANGVATLDSGSKIPASQLPASVMEYKGAYNIVTNTPALIDGTGDNGDAYRCSVGGSRDFGSGSITVLPGDFLIYNGTIWEKIPSEDIVQSVNGQIGIVTLDTDDVTEGTNLYYPLADKTKLAGLDLPHDHVYFVGKHGNDSNSGLSPDKAFLTFGAAITEASTQTPTSTNRFVLYCNDAGVYSEDVVTSDWIDIKAQSAVLDGVLTPGNNTSTRICTVDKIIKSTVSGSAYVDCCFVNTPDGETGVLNSGSASVLTIFARKVKTPLNGIGIRNTGTGHMHLLVNHSGIVGNSGIAIQCDVGEVTGTVDLITEDGTPTTTTGIKVTGGSVNLTTSTITADTAWDISNGATLRLSTQSVIGTRTVENGGIAEISEASKSTDDLAATGIVNGTGLVELNADPTKIDIDNGIYYIKGVRYVYAGGTAISPTIGAGDSSTFVGFDASGLVYSETKWTNIQKQTILPLARLQAVQGQTGPGSTLITPIDQRFIISENGYLQRLWQEEAIGALYNSGGIYNESSTALQLDQTAGIMYSAQRNRIEIPVSADIEAKAVYHVSGSWSVQTQATLVIPKFYDNGTDIVGLGPSKHGAHTLLKGPKEDDQFFLIYSDTEYGSLAAAQAAPANYGVFVSQAASGVIAVCNIILTGSSTSIESIVDFRPRIGQTGTIQF